MLKRLARLRYTVLMSVATASRNRRYRHELADDQLVTSFISPEFLARLREHLLVEGECPRESVLPDNPDERHWFQRLLREVYKAHTGNKVGAHYLVKAEISVLADEYAQIEHRYNNLPAAESNQVGLWEKWLAKKKRVIDFWENTADFAGASPPSLNDRKQFFFALRDAAIYLHALVEKEEADHGHRAERWIIPDEIPWEKLEL